MSVSVSVLVSLYCNLLLLGGRERERGGDEDGDADKLCIVNYKLLVASALYFD
jgi:hypothetical protein